MPAQIIETISANPGALLPINNPSQTVSFIQQGLSSSFNGPPSFAQCTSQNQALADNPSNSGGAQFNASFSEEFSTTFKKRNVATTNGTPNALANQNNLTGGSYNTETDFYNNTFPAISGQGNAALAGLADQGTRLIVNFQNVPSGVSLFTQVSPPASSGPDIIRMTSTDAAGGGPFTPVPPNVAGLAPIALTGGSGIAAFEDLQSDPNTFATVNIPIYVAYDSTVGLPSLGTASVSTSLGPFSPNMSADGTSPVPRFVQGVSGGSFSISACACASNMSAPVTVTRGGFSFSFGSGRFQQRVTIQNTGGSSIAGPISLVLDNLSSNATLANATGVTSCAAPAGSAYITVNAGALAPGASASVVLQFTHTGAAGITYTTRILGGSGGQ